MVVEALGNKQLFTGSQRWHARHALELKAALRPKELHYVLASATLTPAVGRLAVRMLGDHTYIDADLHHVEHCTKQALMEKIANPTAIAKPEAYNAPVQLQQYAMVVTCKWRLPALVSFIKQHAHEKVVVFVSTCDSVDFHMSLFRDTSWPQTLDDKKDDSTSTLGVAEPLTHTAIGLFGPHCPMFRLHGNLPQVCVTGVDTASPIGFGCCLLDC